MNYMHRYSDDQQEEFRKQFQNDPSSLLEIDENEAEILTERIEEFYRDHLDESGMDGYVIGLSGGIDSTTVAYLLERAVGSENIQGVIMPASHSSSQNAEDAEAVADELGIKTNDYEEFQDSIDDIVDSLEELGDPVDDEEQQRLKRGNILSRCRMIVLRDTAKANDYLVAGTTNASENELGYMTLAADGKGGIDNEALLNLYKTTVRDLASYLDVPQRIIDKEPTADLWKGQRDADELSFGYDTLDRMLAGLRLDLDEDEISQVVDEVDIDDIEAVQERVEQTRFKREPAPSIDF